MKPTAAEVIMTKDIVAVLMNRGFRSAISYHDGRLGFNHWKRHNFNFLTQKQWRIFCGCTKACILIPELKNWVIKVGFRDYTNQHFSVDREDLDWLGEFAKMYRGDYCEVEARFYQMAQQRGVDQFFAAEYKVFDYNGVNIYLQEYAEPDGAKITHSFEEYVQDWYDPKDYKDEDDYWTAVSEEAEDLDEDDRIYALFGRTSEADSLYAFLDEMMINDLHNENWGFKKDGSIVVFDYSGFHR